MKLNEAWDIVGGLSRPSKMPGYAYGLPAGESCPAGSKLMHVKDSVCEGCYALKGRYRFHNVRAAQKRRLESLKNPRWVEAMVTLIKELRIEWFRWHDSGDLQDLDHYEMILKVARACPHTNFWLPTRELNLVRAKRAPKNLCVRVSAAMVDGKPPSWPNTSTVVSTSGGADCPAPRQEGQCKDCRRCWDKEVKNVAYRRH